MATLSLSKVNKQANKKKTQPTKQKQNPQQKNKRNLKINKHPNSIQNEDKIDWFG